ncbi:hypothetical protein DB44_DT00480 [Candidatus Protochlamydia amoebophila]|uniref:Uncharacterized protein n=1 Tax=Candidatus Protochlamydia amoebophila TaxID=362787 RepID=A0A0C1H955_9BACT|nr:hypothetical protein DB44_DT00480 [Candidatus Protochlamydia amoebophila]
MPGFLHSAEHYLSSFFLFVSFLKQGVNKSPLGPVKVNCIF